MQNERSRTLVTEFVGTMFLLVGVVGSGIMAERLSPDDVGLQLLQNAMATGAVLVAIISIFETLSADINPAVTVGAWLLGHRSGREVVPLVATQVVGACAGTVVANLMFDLRWLELSHKARAGGHLWLAESARLGLGARKSAHRSTVLASTGPSIAWSFMSVSRLGKDVNRDS